MDNISNAKRFRNLSKFYESFIENNFRQNEKNKVLLKKRSAIRTVFMPDGCIEFNQCLCPNRCVLIETCRTKPYIKNKKWICCE